MTIGRLSDTRRWSDESAQAPGETPVRRYERLVEKIDGIIDDPNARMRLANEMYSLAVGNDARSLPHLRLQALLQTVRLDPFRRQFRLALVRAQRELGLVSEAMAVLQSVKNDGFALDDEGNLELGQTLLESGKVNDARAHFKDVHAGKARVQAEFDLIECDLRSAGTVDEWKKVLRSLKDLKLPDFGPGDSQIVGLFSEKCLKFAVECDDQALIDELVQVAKAKLDSNRAPGSTRHPVYRLFLSVVRLPESVEFPAGALEGLLLAHRLIKRTPVTGEEEDRIKAMKEWRNLITTKKSRWFGLNEAYLHVIDGWAMDVYRRKEFQLAQSLWSEAERVAPSSPQVLKNLAIVSTRMADESNFDWYWNRLTRVWNLQAELAPEADGYMQALQEKCQAFSEGAEKKLAGVRVPEDRLELALIWAKEGLSFRALRQLRFRNAFLRCGVLTEDFANETERDTLLDIGHRSASRALELVAHWQQLGGHSELARHRQARLDDALSLAKTQGSQKYVGYDIDKDAFLAHRKATVCHFLGLLGLLQQMNVNVADAEIRRKMAVVAQCVCSFPLRLLKAEVLKLVPNFTEETHLGQFAEGVALGPWLSLGQQSLRAGDAKKALAILGEALSIAPDSAVVRFLLAQCHATTKNFSQAFEVLVEARKTCEDKELGQQIDQFADQMDFARVDQALEKAKSCLQKNDSVGAVRECSGLRSTFGNHAYLLFMLARAQAANLDFNDAKTSLKAARAARGERKEDELLQGIESFLGDIEKSAPLMVLSKAVPLMQEQHWDDALKVLVKGRCLEPPDPRVTYYEAICLGRSGTTDQAERVAAEALEQCKTLQRAHLNGRETTSSLSLKETGALAKEIEASIPQIPLMAIAQELGDARQAMSKERWSEALGHLAQALRKRPKAVPALFLKAVCCFRMEDWDQAERIAREAQPFCGPHDEDERKQLGLIIEQVPLARIAKDMEAINQCLRKERWEAAFVHIDDVLRKDPTQPACLFYRALCHFRLENWDEADRAARTALKSVTQKEIRDQLNTIVEQIPLARVAKDMDEINKCLKKERWAAALERIDAVLRKEAAHPMCLFYRALCHFRLENWDEAERAARLALGSVKQQEIRDQLNMIVKGIEHKKQEAKLSGVISAINRQAHGEALRLLEPHLRESPRDASLLFFKGLCEFRQVMDQINSGSLRPSQSLFDDCEATLKLAALFAVDSDMKVQITAVQNNITSVRETLRAQGFW